MSAITYKLVLEYDGACFHGWQRQRDLKTVQGELERTLQTVLCERVTVTGAGRTDAGCHATGQVASFRTRSGRGPEEIARAVNGLMRGELIVRHIEVAAADFNARFSAKSRKYRYLIARRPTALMRDRAWVVTRDLDPGAMREAAGLLCGKHDFTLFSKKSERAEKNPVCDVARAAWGRWELGLSFEMEADRFLHGMVRSVVGTLVRVGAGKLPASSVAEMLRGRGTRRAGPAAPAWGLYLAEVRY